MPTNNIIPITQYKTEIHNNYLDKDIKSIIYPFHLFLALLFSSKYRIKGNYIFPIDNKSLFLRLLCVCYVIGVTGHRIWHRDVESFIYSGDIYIVKFISLFLPVTRCLAFVVDVIINFVYRHSSVLLILIIQSIQRTIDISEDISSLITCNWILTLTVLCIDIFVFVTIGTATRFFNLFNCFSEILLINFDVDFVYTIQILVLLIKCLEGWVRHVEMVNVGEDEKLYYEKLFVTYQHILIAFDLYKKVSHVLIFYRTMNALCRSLSSFEFTMQFVKTVKLSNEQIQVSKLLTNLMLVLGIVKDVLQFILHCVYCEKFYTTVEEAETACIKLTMNGNCSYSHGRLCMNVLRQNRSSFIKMSACGLFQVDTMLLLSVMGLLTNYAFVLLQFAFL